MNNQTGSSLNNSEEIELLLNDTFLEKSLNVNESNDNTIMKAEADAMPSVLVDQLLLSEIESIPDRFGFKIGDVADLLGIKQYILRYWEQEFEILKPKKASNNQRLYNRKDVENAFLIKKLLYRDRFSIEGARQALKDVKFALKKEKNFSSTLQKIDEKNIDSLNQIKSFVLEIRKVKQLFT